MIAVAIGLAVVASTAIVAVVAYKAFLKFLEFKTPKPVHLPLARLEELEDQMKRVNLAIGIRTIPMTKQEIKR